MLSQKVRMGMVGGGPGAFIGDIHRKASALDGAIELVAGAFSRSAQNSQLTGAQLGLNPSRVNSCWQTMLESEASRPSEERMEVVSIVTPNHLHLPIATKALELGFHVISDKPATKDFAEVLALQETVRRSQSLYGLTHTYLGYPMVKEARSLVANGELGTIRKVIVEYPQGWLSTLLESSNHKQASWRGDPDQSGPSGAMGDIGTHAETLCEYITGQSIQTVCADLSTFVQGRRQDDDGSVLLRLSDGARGVLTASQICHGEENNLSIRVYGEQGGVIWSHEEANTLWLKRQGKPAVRLRAGSDNDYLSPATRAHCRTPGGHPEGFLEAFANIYRNFALAVEASRHGADPDPMFDYPTIKEGVASLAFVDAVLRSQASDHKWTEVAS